jgi:TolB-like protein
VNGSSGLVKYDMSGKLPIIDGQRSRVKSNVAKAGGDQNMNIRNIRTSLFFLMALYAVFLLIGCAAAPDAVQQERVSALDGQAPKTLAILPFENNSVTDPETFAPLSKGLSAMLITDLNKSGSTLQLIERSKIESLLKEVALSQTGSIEKSTAVKVGKILGAQSIAFGSFMVIGVSLRIDVRIINVETSELIISESISGSSNDFMELEGKLAQKIADSLRVVFIPPIDKWENNLNAALSFSKGLEALDQGNKAEATALFQRSIDLDPAFQTQVENVEGLNQ